MDLKSKSATILAESVALSSAFLRYKHCLQGRTLRVAKNNAVSETVRKTGNYIYEKKKHDFIDHEEIWQKYCMSIAVAIKNSEVQALAYANRSAYLIHMSKIQEAIADLDRALKITKSSTSKVKWLCRKAKCLAAVGLPGVNETIEEAKCNLTNITENKSDYEKIIKAAEISKGFNKQRKGNESTSIKKPELEKRADDFSSVTIKSNDKLKKHLAATKDIKAGEVIFIESPYVSSLNLLRAHAYCSHCFRTCWNMIPCDSCSWCMYCSETCQKNAWKEYHYIECPAYGFMIKEEDDNTDVILCCLRLLIKSLQESGDITSLTVYFTEKPETLANNKAENNESQSSLLISMLWCYGINPFKSQKFLFLALRLVVSLARYTTFFGKKLSDFEFDNTHLEDNPHIFMIGGLLTRLLNMVEIFGILITNESEQLSSREHDYENSHLQRGYCLTPYFNLINYSCNPNVNKCFTEDGKLVVYALQPIKKDEQLLYSYDNNVYYHRAKYLRCMEFDKISFYCTCNACEEDWPPVLFIAEDLLKKDDQNSIKRLFKKPLEVELYQKHKDVIRNLVLKLNNDFNVTEEMVKSLADSVTLAGEKLTHPNLVMCLLQKALSVSFEQVYAGRLLISKKCHT